MKKVIVTSILLAFLWSCKKEAPGIGQQPTQLQAVLARLHDSLSAGQLANLDTIKVYITSVQSFTYYRFPFIGKDVSHDFLLVKADSNSRILQGRLVSMKNSGPTATSGEIALSSLSGKLVLRSTITNGYIDALHPGANTPNQLKQVDSKTVTMLPAPDADWLPEVIVIGYGGGSSTSAISLDGFLGSPSGSIIGGGGTSDAPGNPGDGGGGGSSSGSGGNSISSPAYVPQDPTVRPTIGRGAFGASPLVFEPEYMYSIPVIDIKTFFNCFDQIPDAGASFSVQLCVDVPLNGDPAASSNVSAFSAGHSFLIVSKSSGGVAITQTFGFYPAVGISMWDPFSSRPSAIRDNSGQEINGSLSMSLSASQFSILKAAAINLSAKPYILDASNCTDYALGVINSIRSQPLTLQPYIMHQPGVSVSGASLSPGFDVSITNSPQRLYELLSQMKSAGSPESSNIQLDLSHNSKAPLSHGPCN